MNICPIDTDERQDGAVCKGMSVRDTPLLAAYANGGSGFEGMSHDDSSSKRAAGRTCSISGLNSTRPRQALNVLRTHTDADVAVSAGGQRINARPKYGWH